MPLIDAIKRKSPLYGREGEWIAPRLADKIVIQQDPMQMNQAVDKRTDDL